MKRALKSALIIILAVLMISPNAVFAASNEYTEPTETEVYNERATGLIAAYGVYVSKQSAGVLAIIGTLDCIADVVKCGYRDFLIQRRPQNSAVWENYMNLGDLYLDASTYPYSQTLTVPTGFYYRVSCTFYAKKNIFSTQKIEDYTSSGVLI